jgi:hypothetical protein
VYKLFDSVITAMFCTIYITLEKIPRNKARRVENLE